MSFSTKYKKKKCAFFTQEISRPGEGRRESGLIQSIKHPNALRHYVCVPGQRTKCLIPQKKFPISI